MFAPTSPKTSTTISILPAWKDCNLFYRYAAEIGALPAAPEISFSGSVKAAIV